MLSMNAMSKRTAEKARAVFGKYGLEAEEPVVKPDWVKGDHYCTVHSVWRLVAGNRKIIDALRADSMPVARETDNHRQFFRTCIKVKFTASGEEVPVWPK